MISLIEIQHILSQSIYGSSDDDDKVNSYHDLVTVVTVYTLAISYFNCRIG